MKITAYPQPSILHEAVELVHALVNQTPVEQLGRKFPCGVPAEELQRIRENACEGLEPDSEEMQFFFRGVPFEDKKEGLSSIARNMVYAWAEEIYGDADEMADYLLRYWRRHRGTLRIRNVDLYGVSVYHDEQGKFHNLTKELSKLPLPAAYQMQLVETMSYYEFYLQRLLNLLRPVLDRLPALLLPLVQRAAPLLQQWESFFAIESNFREFFIERVAVDFKMPRELRLYLRYFQPCTGWIFFADSFQTFNVHLGIGLESGIAQVQKSTASLETCDYMALRQMANADRMSMLLTMMDNSMTAQEVARKLELHPSSVFRDLNSMSNSKLLIKEVSGGKSTYRTNYPFFEELFRNILQILNHDGHSPTPG